MSENWCVAVFKCAPDKVKSIVDIYEFAKGIKGVENLHFLIRDRIGNEVVVSLRLQIDPKDKKAIMSKMIFELGTLFSEDKFVVDPSNDNGLYKFVAWNPEEAIKGRGLDKFALFCIFLSELSKVVVKMMKKKYFSSGERVELAHVFSWMLGCAEYGRLSTTHFEIGYYDRVEKKENTYLKSNFSE